MKYLNGLFTGLILVLTLAPQLRAQHISIRPHLGYYVPRMNDVNDTIENQIRVWRELLETDLSDPGKIDGGPIIGGQIQFHLNESYFIALSAAYYREKSETAFAADDRRFAFTREVEFLDVQLNIQYYFDYEPGTIFNKYLNLGIGVMNGQADARTINTFPASLVSGAQLPRVDTTGDFSRSSLTASITAGIDVRLASLLSLWLEGGLQFGNIGQLDGTVTRLDADPVEDLSSTEFDFTGFFLRTGFGIGL